MNEQQPKRVFLIDTMSHIFRAFFAPMGRKGSEPLRNSKGQVTQAVFVFTSMLRKLLADEQPEYVAAVFDSAAPTFRHDAYAAYKANRPDMPDDLSSQMPYIVKVCEALRIPILKMDGFEADDIIGTMAKKVEEKGMQAVIVSNDKDLCQLVSDPLIVCMRQNSQNIKRTTPVPPVEWCDEKWVENKFGLPPSKIVDLLGLMGDSIDNIPGAKGIGEKGAVKLILEYGSAEGAMANADKVTHKTYRESLQTNQDEIRQSLELATVHCEVPLELDLDALRLEEPDRKLAYRLFSELEFSTLTREFADSAPLFDGQDGGRVVETRRNYHIIKNKEDLDKLVRRLWETENWSFEVDDSNSEKDASSFDKKPPCGVAIAVGAGFSNYIDLENFAEGKDEAVAQLKDILANGFLDKSVHDYKRNLAVLSKLNITPEAVTDDTMIAAYLIDSSRPSYNLPLLGQLNLGEEIAFEISEGWMENQYRTAERADFTYQLAPSFRRKIEEDGLEKIYTEIEMPLIPLLYKIEMAGMKVDAEALGGFSDFVATELEGLSERIFKLAGREFNINSPKQVGEVLAELNIESKRKTATGQISTSKDVMLEIAENYEIAQLILDYRELDKLKATYADALPVLIASDGRIHGSLNQTVATTGRLSCLPAGTLVNTGRGLVGIETVKVGEKIRTPYGLRKVSAWQTTGKKTVVVLKLSNGITLRCSPEHKIRSLGKWVKAKNLVVGDAVYMSYTKGVFGRKTAIDIKPISSFQTSKSPKLPSEWSPDLAEFVGYCMADGHIVSSNYNGKPSRVVLAFGWEDDALIEHFAAVAYRLFDKRPKKRTTRSCVILDLPGCDIAGALIQLGAGGKSGVIRVPQSLFTAPESIVAAFLRGYFEGDGSVTKSANGMLVRSTSYEMLTDVQQLLTLFGIPSTVLTGSHDSHGYAARHTLRILGDRSKKVFHQKIGFLSDRKKEMSAVWMTKKNHRSNAELLRLPKDFDINVIKPIVYDFYRGKNGNVPMTTMVWASKYTARNIESVTLPRLEWVRKALVSKSEMPKGKTENFIDEAVNGKLYEIRIKEILYEEAVPMFDITVEDVEQYLAQGIIVHNSTNPNLQNIPIRTELGQQIRRAFIPETGCKLISADYSQLELRLLAHITRDEIMLEAFKNGEDIHSKTAELVFGAKTPEQMKDARRMAKIVNFAIAYAVEAYGLSQRVDLSRSQAKEVIEDYYNTYKGIKKFMEDTPKLAKEQGFVTSMLGRRRYLPSINDRNYNVRSRAEREAINMPIQGFASDIVKIAMLKVDAALKRENLKTQMIMQVHDELLFESPDAEVEKVIEIVKREMELAFELDVPLTVEIAAGKNWMTAK